MAEEGKCLSNHEAAAVCAEPDASTKVSSKATPNMGDNTCLSLPGTRDGCGPSASYNH